MQHASSGHQGASFGWRPEQRAQLRSLIARHAQLLLTGLVTVGAAARTPAQHARPPPPCPQQPESQVTCIRPNFPPCAHLRPYFPQTRGPAHRCLEGHDGVWIP